jgi:hypothetical protein
MALNGRLPDSALAPIAGGRLRKDAAASWNAMNDEARRRYGVTLLPLGDASSYRTYGQQLYLWDHVPHAHDTNWVARPGTSNHGWGLAVDLRTRQMRWIVDQIGAKYGWAKVWSDAPVEWWHIRYSPEHDRMRGHYGLPVIQYGQKGASVRRLQHYLRLLGFKSVPGKRSAGYGYFGIRTRWAVKRFQRKHKLRADGVVGPATWAALRRALH